MKTGGKLERKIGSLIRKTEIGGTAVELRGKKNGHPLQKAVDTCRSIEVK